jgi:predicted nucleic acid-binding Zn ribbon protein
MQEEVNVEEQQINEACELQKQTRRRKWAALLMLIIFLLPTLIRIIFWFYNGVNAIDSNSTPTIAPMFPKNIHF